MLSSFPLKAMRDEIPGLCRASCRDFGYANLQLWATTTGVWALIEDHKATAVALPRRVAMQ